MVKSEVGKAKVHSEPVYTISFAPLSVETRVETVTEFMGRVEEHGVPVPNKTVDFFVDGEKVDSKVTDSGGKFSFSYKWTEPGEHTYYVEVA